MGWQGHIAVTPCIFQMWDFFCTNVNFCSSLTRERRKKKRRIAEGKKISELAQYSHYISSTMGCYPESTLLHFNNVDILAQKTIQVSNSTCTSKSALGFAVKQVLRLCKKQPLRPQDHMSARFMYSLAFCSAAIARQQLLGFKP
jgi:hypothetical protein